MANEALSPRFLKRSILASLVFSSSLFVIWALLFPDRFELLYDEDGTTTSIVLLFLIYTLFLNLIPDYIALVKTRYFIRAMRGKRLAMALLIIIADAAASVVISVAAIFVMFHFFWHNPTLGGVRDTLDDLLNYLPLIITGNVIRMTEFTVFHPLAPNFYSTFLASVWLWLYVGSALVLRLLPFAQRAASFRCWFALDEKPFHCVAAMSTILIFIGYVVAIPFVVAF